MSTVESVARRTTLHPGEVDASPPPGRDEESGRRISSQVLIGVSLLVTWLLVYLFGLSGLEQGQSQSALYDRLRTELAEGTAPTGAPIEPGSPVALLSAPAAGIEDLVVVEGSRPSQLQDGAGHVLGSVLPGQQGVSMVAGRSLSFGAPFARIAELPLGAPLTVTTGQGVFSYEVVGARTDGDPTLPAPAAGAARLTLVTASRGGGLGGLQPKETVYVDAALAEGAVAPGPVSTKDTAVELMSTRTDTTTLALLALSLQVLVIALVGFAWSWTSWSRAATWIAGAPCVLAALWLATSVASRLLPALI
ncbi:class E sortase [Nocardioides sp. W7]|uniref:class E sortase n=1 Tax=Nocardioides sp. W7 TaxID=2931390 RepID=UPI001FD4AC9A|nr:class E sortase [Nocardioides sp. W7]